VTVGFVLHLQQCLTLLVLSDWTIQFVAMYILKVAEYFIESEDAHVFGSSG